MSEEKYVTVPFFDGDDDSENLDGVFIMPDNTMKPLFEMGDYLFIESKDKLQDYLDGDICIAQFDGELHVRQLWRQKNHIILQDFAGVVDVFEPSAFGAVQFVGKICSLYRRVPDVCPDSTSTVKL